MIQAPLRIVFLDAATFGDVSLDRFKASWDCTIHPLSAQSEIPGRLEGYLTAVINKVRLNRSVLEMPTTSELRLIVVAATGTDNVDLDGARARGIKVCNVPGYASHSVARFTMSLILELATHVGRYGQVVRAGAWQKSPMFTRLDFPSVELYGKKLGIIGYGSIGRSVAEMARGFGMEVLVSARPGSPEPVPESRLALIDLLGQSDFVTLHCPLTPQTRNLIDSRALALMKPAAFLINTARGGLVDELALIDVLKKKRLAGAALDVLTEEPPSPAHPVIIATQELENLLVTPHCAWSATEARQRLLDEVAENIVAFLQGQERNCVV